MLLRLAILFLAVVIGQSALAERKAALLIGNATYAAPATVLKNPPNDITVMKTTLESVGFEVTVLQDAGRAAMSAALATFEEKVAGADIGLIYYSGHGIEVSGDNFLIPVDAKLASDRDVKYETILLDDLLHALAGATKLKLVLLDACRDNPFLTSMKRISTRGIPTRGLARVDSAESNMLIGYATAPGEVALDGDGTMSPYATALSRHLVTPGLEIEAALRAVAKDVFEATDGRQRPFKTGSLFETVILGHGGAPDAAGSAIGQGDPCRDAAAHWAEIRESKDKAMFEDHLRLFPACAFANIARQRMAALAPAVSLRETNGETECDRLAAAENDPFKLAVTKGVDFYQIDFARAIPACEAAIRENPDEKRFAYQLGRALDHGGRFAEALAQYRKAADLGNHQAMRNLAILYENGEGAAQDRTEAMRWFRKSADLGNAFAMNKVGLLYDEGLGIAKDKKEAYRWFSKAAEAGNVEAMTSLGFALTNGDGVKQNHTLAMEWYRKAADAGNAQAFNNIGTMYERGRAVRKDRQEALKWYVKAAENGNGQGAQNAAAILDGTDKENDPVTAAAWMEKALRLGQKGAVYQMKENATAWSLKFRKALQQRLAEAGVYSGAIDGQFGPSTIRAVEAIFDQKAG